MTDIDVYDIRTADAYESHSPLVGAVVLLVIIAAVTLVALLGTHVIG